MKKPVLVVMAAGMGSRYGGLKQIDPVDKEGHIIMDFSIYDAVQAGFQKVVFIIKKENEADFRSAIGDRLSNQLEVSYVFQDLHNIPEGLSAGAVFAGVLAGNDTVTMAGAFALAIGIAIQNFPEGAIISMPLRGAGISRGKAFLWGAASGIVEPIAGGVTLLLASQIQPLLPYLLAFAAGAMIYVVVEELIPEANEGEHSNVGIIAFAVGFGLMMVLDVALG